MSEDVYNDPKPNIICEGSLVPPLDLAIVDNDDSPLPSPHPPAAPLPTVDSLDPEFSSIPSIVHPDLLRAILLPIDHAIPTSAPVDRYGFALSTEFVRKADFPPPAGTPWTEPSPADERLAIEWWSQALRNWTHYHDIDAPKTCPGYQALRRAGRRGIPDCMRGRVWSRLLGADILCEVNEAGNDGLYSRALATPLPFEEQGVIGRDLRRTFAGCGFLANRAGVATLARILCAAATYMPRIGYVQSFTFLTASLLSYLTETQAFWAFNTLLRRNNLHFQFADGLPGTIMRAMTLDVLLPRHVPRWPRVVAAADGLLAHSPSAMWATKFIMTLFFRDLPFQVAASIFDRYLIEGERVIYRVLCAMVSRELAGPLCKTQADLTKAHAQGKLPALDSPAFAATGSAHEVLERLTTIGQRVTLANAGGLLKAADAVSIDNGEVKRIYDQWTAGPGADMQRNSQGGQSERLSAHRAARKDEEALAQARRFAELLTTDIRFAETEDRLVGPITEEVAAVLCTA